MWKFKNAYSEIDAYRIEKILMIINHLKQTYRNVSEVVTFYEEQGFNETNLCSLAAGIPGLIILTVELDSLFPEESWQKVGHEYVHRLQTLINNGNVYSLSLWSGLSGIAVSTSMLARKNKNYAKMTDALHSFILSNLQQDIEHAIDNLYGHVDMFDYDCMEGLSGVGRYLLQYDDKESVSFTKAILNYLVTLCNKFNKKGDLVPGWYIPGSNQFLEEERIKYRQGNFNLSISHGIVGPLSLLSSAYMKGIEVKGQLQAIEAICTFLERWKQHDHYGIVWPDRVSLEEYIADSRIGDTINNESWCYGIPGICHALLLAANALNDSNYESLAIRAYKEMMNRPIETWSLKSPTFCHGFAGFLYLLYKIHLKNGRKWNRNYIDKALEAIFVEYNPKLAFGFQDYDHGPMQNPGLLVGTAGILLVLMSILKQEDYEWDYIFLIS
ncbi:lanthionine synthetase C family protein [Paenibacillus larvae]|uniref:lanthionine synthetase C family protein n=1 Tax=Paenibacillus larvae TaxID=1464 RepID=UPI00227EAE53|nr:lanthionine synthetase C family protein [Paenibacillus larvae]MCY9510034.1 lanthionine synthetase C family protein [Paenibacillus larvae]MCY9527321.1 lanthionine synthetase C family protein [Paenibacillus larvae]